jgi:hypothetical protein
VTFLLGIRQQFEQLKLINQSFHAFTIKKEKRKISRQPTNHSIQGYHIITSHFRIFYSPTYQAGNKNYSTIASAEISAAGTSDFLLFFPECHNKHQLKV